MRWVLAMVLLGCASAPAPHTQRASDAVLDEWVGRHQRSPAPAVHVAAAQHRVHTVDRRRSQARIAVTGRRIDVAFRRAPLSEALRLLAEEAHLNLVIADDVGGEVSLHLRSVHPYAVIEALAEAHGAEVSRQGNLVVVRSR